MSEIGPVVAERWDHDAAERGEGPTRLALRVQPVAYGPEMGQFLAELDPDAEIVSITPVDAGMAQVVWRVPVPQAAPEADDGFAALVWAETSPGWWVGDTSNGGTLTVTPASVIPGAWGWTVHGRLFMVGYGLAGSEDEAKRRAWRAWREFEAVREEAGNGE